MKKTLTTFAFFISLTVFSQQNKTATAIPQQTLVTVPAATVTVSDAVQPVQTLQEVSLVLTPSATMPAVTPSVSVDTTLNAQKNTFNGNQPAVCNEKTVELIPQTTPVSVKPDVLPATVTKPK